MQEGKHYHEENDEEISSEENTKPELKQDFILHYEKLCRGGANKVNHSLVDSVLTQLTLRYHELIQGYWCLTRIFLWLRSVGSMTFFISHKRI